MSIELKQAAQQALEALEARCGTNADERQPGGAIEALRTAIQQAESGACKSFTELRERHREGVDAEIAAMAAEAETDERAAFEAEMRREDVWGHRSLKKRPDGRYQNWQVDLMWDVWQARSILALRPVQVPMNKQDAWDNSPVNSDWEAVDAYLQGIEDAESHHHITAQAKKEGA